MYHSDVCTAAVFNSVHVRVSGHVIGGSRGGLFETVAPDFVTVVSFEPHDGHGHGHGRATSSDTEDLHLRQ